MTKYAYIVETNGGHSRIIDDAFRMLIQNGDLVLTDVHKNVVGTFARGTWNFCIRQKSQDQSEGPMVLKENSK